MCRLIDNTNAKLSSRQKKKTVKRYIQKQSHPYPVELDVLIITRCQKTEGSREKRGSRYVQMVAKQDVRLTVWYRILKRLKKGEDEY